MGIGWCWCLKDGYAIVPMMVSVAGMTVASPLMTYDL